MSVNMPVVANRASFMKAKQNDLIIYEWYGLFNLSQAPTD